MYVSVRYLKLLALQMETRLPDSPALIEERSIHTSESNNYNTYIIILGQEIIHFVSTYLCIYYILHVHFPNY